MFSESRSERKYRLLSGGFSSASAFSFGLRLVFLDSSLDDCCPEASGGVTKTGASPFTAGVPKEGKAFAAVPSGAGGGAMTGNKLGDPVLGDIRPLFVLGKAAKGAAGAAGEASTESVAAVEAPGKGGKVLEEIEAGGTAAAEFGEAAASGKPVEGITAAPGNAGAGSIAFAAGVDIVAAGTAAVTPGSGGKAEEDEPDAVAGTVTLALGKAPVAPGTGGKAAVAPGNSGKEGGVADAGSGLDSDLRVSSEGGTTLGMLVASGNFNSAAVLAVAFVEAPGACSAGGVAGSLAAKEYAGATKIIAEEKSVLAKIFMMLSCLGLLIFHKE